MFFQNLFNQEFRGNWVLSDRQYVLTFDVPPNQNQNDYQLAWNVEPYNFSSVPNLTINYAIDADLKGYVQRPINVAGSVPASTKAQEVVDKLNADPFFSDHFLARTKSGSFDGVEGVTAFITSKSGRRRQTVSLFISNTGAETKLRFNKKAGVAELPSYYKRHTIDNRYAVPDSLGTLVLLDELNPDHVVIIKDAGLDPANMQDDWELLGGRASGLFTFKKQTVDASSRVTAVIEYGAGAVVGDFARKTTMTYTGTQTQPDQITQIPYVLASGDLVTP
jgi:hypothetical protein